MIKEKRICKANFVFGFSPESFVLPTIFDMSSFAPMSEKKSMVSIPIMAYIFVSLTVSSVAKSVEAVNTTPPIVGVPPFF